MSIITTSDGEDLISGSAETDTITSGAGNDVIRGGAGADQIDAGPGNDTIELHREDSGQGWDTITGFTSGQDKLALVGFTKIDSFDDLAPFIQSIEGDTVIDLSAAEGLPASGPLVLDGLSGVTAADFQFGATTLLPAETFDLGLLDDATFDPAVTTPMIIGPDGETPFGLVGVMADTLNP